MKLVGACLLFMTGMAVYLPTIYIRKTLRLLEQIAANGRK